jgi:transposase
MTTNHPATELQVAVRANDTKLFASLELSKSQWLVTVSAPGSVKLSKHAVIGGDGGALRDLLGRRRATAERRVGMPVQVVVIQEAGLDGFWLHRLLEANGTLSHVVDPASLAVDRRHRRAKTDAIDGEMLLRTLMAWARGERRVCSMVRPPSPAEEDRRRLTRERGTLLKERTQHTNRLRGLLYGQGITDYDPLRKDRLARLDARQTGDGRPLPERLKAEIRRELDRVDLVAAQIATVERARDALVGLKSAAKPETAAAALARLKGIGYRARLADLAGGLVPRLRPSTADRGLCRIGAEPLAERWDRPRARHLEVWQPPPALCHGRARLVLAPPSAGLRPERLVAGARRASTWAGPPDRDRGARPQAAGGALALCDPGRHPARRRLQGLSHARQTPSNGLDRDQAVGSGRAATADQAPWLRHAVQKDHLALPSPAPSSMRDDGAGVLHPTGCEVMRSSWPHGESGLELWIQNKQGDPR